MATATLHRAETDRRVTHPLQRLRSVIRLYVTLEGLAVLALYLALWFWIGLLLDYGFFKLFTIDWVQELPYTFRLVVLCGLLAGLVAVVFLKVLLLLFREFRDAPLALVLERRYPDLLGDRLITAVELADPRLAERYGYSQPMIDQTIQDAAERVDRLSIKEVFDWRRLRRLGVVVGVLTVGLYLLVGAAYCVWYGTTDVAGYVWRFNDVAAIWFERNVLLYDIIWPRQAYLELLDFPADELRIGRDAPPPTLRVRAVRWVIADPNRSRAPEGWRALIWADLTTKLLGSPRPDLKLPAEWEAGTVDAIEIQLEKADVVNSLPADTVLALRHLLDQLHERAQSPEMSRKLREFQLPESVEVRFQGATVRSEQTLPPGLNHEYSGTVSSLRESLRFTVRAKDYYTPKRQITVVPPPSVIELKADEAHPAYLYHRVPVDGGAADLKGKKHLFKDRPVSLTGEKSVVQVPAGTDLVLTAHVDKTLKELGVRFLPPKPAMPVPQVAIEQPDDHTFRTRFTNVTAPHDFIFEITDTDHVVGRRHVEVKPIHDTAPEVDAQVEVVRKVNQNYLITAVAQVPFSGKVRDDRGLATVEYTYTVERVETPAVAGLSAGVAVNLTAAPPGGLGRHLAAVGLLRLLANRPAADDSRPRSVGLATFDRLFREDSRKAVTRERLAELLSQPPQWPLLKDFELDPDLEYFPVSSLGLKAADARDVLPHFRLRLWVTATDNNVETGPHTGQSKEKFTFLVVTENELLAEIAKEEEGLHVKLEEAVNRLKDGKIKLDKVAQELPELKPEEFSPMARRTEEIDDGLTKSWDAAREVYSDYRRILKELKANQVKADMVSKVQDKICEPLDLAINSYFGQSDEALRDLQKKLDAKTSDPQAVAQARQKLQALIDHLSGVLDHMSDIANLNKLIASLVAIRTKEQEQYEQLKLLEKQKQNELLDKLGGEPPAKDKK